MRRKLLSLRGDPPHPHVYTLHEFMNTLIRFPKRSGSPL